MTLIQFKNNKLSDRLPAMPSFFGDFFNDFLSDELVSRNVFKSVPAVNIKESGENYMVELAAPGMDKNDFRIEVDKSNLTISAERKEEKKEENEKFTRKEFSYSTFSRTFTMPEHVNADAITAEYKNGVLMLNLPKKEEAKEKGPKQIAIS